MQDEAEKFARILVADGRGEEVDLSNPDTMGYDSPWTFQNRRNDVLFNIV